MTDHPQHAPSQRWQHGTLPETGDTGGQAVQRPVALLRRAGRIGDAEVAAADRYYRDYAIGWEDTQGEHSPSDDPYTAYFGARAAVGFPGRHLLAFAVLQDVSVGAMAAFYALPVKRIQNLLVSSLDTLTAYYATLDGGRPAPETAIRAAGVRS